MTGRCGPLEVYRRPRDKIIRGEEWMGVNRPLPTLQGQ
jgi:hypothetical protein